MSDRELGTRTVQDERIVLITGGDLAHRYVANALASAIPLAAIVVDHGKRLSIGDRVKQLWRRYTIVQLFSRAGLFLLRTVLRDKSIGPEKLKDVLGRENCSEFLRPDLLHHVEGINTKEGVGTVTALQPDILLVYGTGIVGQKVLSLGRRIALNMHTGISPLYRGCDCAFWPVHNEELHLLGATVHECTAKVDGGKIFGTANASLQSEDCLFGIFARCVQAGSALYARIVQEVVVSHSAGMVQDLTVGREYRAHMRGLRAEWRTRRKVKAGLVRRYVEGLRATAPSRQGFASPSDLQAERQKLADNLTIHPRRAQ
jgi:methionyl-tRNA formyltransferase